MKRSNSTTGRLGARLERSVGALLAHLGVNLWHGFSESPSAVTFNTVPILVESEGTWLDFNGGAAFAITENLTAFGDVTYSFDVESSDHNLFGGQIGFKVRW